MPQVQARYRRNAGFDDYLSDDIELPEENSSGAGLTIVSLLHCHVAFALDIKLGPAQS